MSTSLLIVLLDPAGQQSAVAAAARRLGHEVVIATGIDTALVLLGTMRPDAIVVCASTSPHDREVVAQLAHTCPDIPVRIIDAPTALETALEHTPLLN